MSPFNTLYKKLCPLSLSEIHESISLHFSVITQAFKSVMDAAPRLPVFDLSELNGPQHDAVVAAMTKAAETAGFFQVVNHGMTAEFLEELKNSVHTFFNQPEEKKALYLKDASPSPTVVHEPHDVSQGKALENLIMNCTEEEDAIHKYAPDSCKEVAGKYLKDSSKLVETILGYLMSNIGVKLDESMVDAYIGGKMLVMNYYPKVASNQEDRVAGTGKHTDAYVLTVLFQDEIGGLLAKLNESGDIDNNYRGEWVEIQPTPGALIIIVGDCLQVLSNGKYRSCEHYVQTKGAEARVSVVAFIMPRSITKIHPLHQVVNKDGGKSIYKEISFEDYYNYAYSFSYSSDYSGKKAVDCLEISFP